MRDSEAKGDDGLPVRASGVWAKEKLYYLEHYLDIFSVGMRKKWRGKLYYIDLFAGPGRCLVRETQEEIDGSPLIALKFDFAKYFFVDADAANYAALSERVKTRSPQKDVVIIPGDCNEEIGKIKPAVGSLGLAFIDPTGISSIAFDTIRALTQSRQMDLIINFHEGMGIRMNLHQYTQREQSALRTFLGSDRTIKKFKSAPSSMDQLCHEITTEYRENLRQIGYQAVDGEQIPVKADKNVLLYYLLFASKHPRGNDYWRKISLIGPHGQRKLGF